MTQYPWTPFTVDLMCRAADRSGYHTLLAEHIARYLSGTECVYEPGCGTGDLSLALGPHVTELTASDIDPLPLQALKDRMREKGIGNIRVLTEDAFALPAERKYDAAVFCYFGMPEQILAHCRAHVRKDVFIIKRSYSKHRFSASEVPITGDSLARMRTLLEEKGIPYTLELLSAEMGQPFRDLDEARRFFSLYSRDSDPQPFTDEMLLKRLVRGPEPDFPFYLPSRKDVGLIHFSMEDL